MFTADEMQAMRDMQAEAMPDTGTIKRATYMSDGFGGHNQTSWATIASNVACRVTPAQLQGMGGQADRTLDIEKYTLRFEWGTDIQDRDRFEWEGQVIEIEDVKVPRSFGTVITCTGEVIKGA